MSRRITALGLLTLCALGCAQEHTSSCPDLAAALAADAMIRAHRCARWVACYRDGNTLWGPRCEDAPDADALCAGLSSGAVVFHRERLDACLADLAACEAAPCYEHLPPGSWPPLTSPCRWSTCRSVLEGAPPVPCSDLDPRGNCVASGECGGMLQPLGAEGALCTFDLRCAPGLHCGEGARCTDTCSRDFDWVRILCDGVKRHDSRLLRA